MAAAADSGTGEIGERDLGNVPFEKGWHVGSWIVPSYDLELNLIYVGTSVTSSALKFMLGGADLTHLYENSTLALNRHIGEAGGRSARGGHWQESGHLNRSSESRGTPLG